MSSITIPYFTLDDILDKSPSQEVKVQTYQSSSLQVIKSSETHVDEVDQVEKANPVKKSEIKSTKDESSRIQPKPEESRSVPKYATQNPKTPKQAKEFKENKENKGSRENSLDPISSSKLKAKASAIKVTQTPNQKVDSNSPLNEQLLTDPNFNSPVSNSDSCSLEEHNPFIVKSKMGNSAERQQSKRKKPSEWSPVQKPVILDDEQFIVCRKKSKLSTALNE